MKVELLHQQQQYSFHENNVLRLAEWIMVRVDALDSTFAWSELSLVFINDRIRDLNREWFGKDTVTDVISFAYPDEASTGEVIVNVQQAYEEGQLRVSPDHELALYIAHGCHHLTGAEDNTPERKKSMLALELKWVKEALSQLNCGPFFK